jgi:AraC-like DNA-binding protein
MQNVQILEILARGAACSFSLLVAISFLRIRSANWAARLGSLFAIGTAAYILFASDLVSDALRPLNIILAPLSILNGAFFWWFATALFDDAFEWRWWRFIPVTLIAIFSIVFFTTPSGALVATAALIAWQTLLVLLMGHAALLAIRDLGDDLVEPRRRFRVAFAALIGLTGIVLAFAEILYANQSFPPIAYLVQSIALLLLSSSFAIWTLQADPVLFAEPHRTGDRTRQLNTDQIAVEDNDLAKRLAEMMEAGVYRETVMSVGGLAERLKTPEHRLRKLINNGLGYRNFTSFLNAYRLEDAKAALADPKQARVQILMIALDLGFGSIAPFNRAFKLATGMTPTAFRRDALSRPGSTVDQS